MSKSTLITVSINYNPNTGTVRYCYNKQFKYRDQFINLLNDTDLYWINGGFATKNALMTMLKKCERRHIAFKRKEKIKKILRHFF